MWQRMARDERGFVLIELMIVLVILSVLAGTVMLGMGAISDTANGATAGANRDTCQVAVAAYTTDHGGVAPTANDDLAPYVSGATPDCL